MKYDIIGQRVQSFVCCWILSDKCTAFKQSGWSPLVVEKYEFYDTVMRYDYA